MSEIITVPDEPYSVYTTSIDGGTYVFRFHWMATNWAWYMTVETPEGARLCTNVKLITGLPLLRTNLNKGPDGQIFLIKNRVLPESTGAKWNIGDHSADFSVIYYTYDELGLT